MDIKRNRFWRLFEDKISNRTPNPPLSLRPLSGKVSNKTLPLFRKFIWYIKFTEQEVIALSAIWELYQECNPELKWDGVFDTAHLAEILILNIFNRGKDL